MCPGGRRQEHGQALGTSVAGIHMVARLEWYDLITAKGLGFRVWGFRGFGFRVWGFRGFGFWV